MGFTIFTQTLHLGITIMMYLILFMIGMGLGFFGKDMIVAKLQALKDAIMAKL